MPGILSLLFGKRKRRRRPAHTRVYGDFSRKRPKGLTKALVKRARKHKVRVTTGRKHKKYKSVRTIKAQIKKKMAAKKRGKRRKVKRRRRRRPRRSHYGIGGNYMPGSMIISPYPRAVMAGPPYI